MAQLMNATVSTKDGLLLTYTVAGNLPDTGHWLLSTTVIAGSDGPIHQYGVKAIDGQSVAAFDFDHVKARRRYFTDVAPLRSGDEWTIRFPLDAAVVKGGANWRADLDVYGAGCGSVEGVVVQTPT